MRRVLILAIVLAMLGIALPAAAVPDEEQITRENSPWTNLKTYDDKAPEGHYVNRGFVKGNAAVVFVYESDGTSGTETIRWGPNADNLAGVPCPKDGNPFAPQEWWNIPESTRWACHHFDWTPPPPPE